MEAQQVVVMQAEAHLEEEKVKNEEYLAVMRKYQESDRGGRALPLTRICEGRRQWTGRTVCCCCCCFQTSRRPVQCGPYQLTLLEL